LQVVAVGGRAFVTGFRLAGVRGVEVGGADDAMRTINQLTVEPNVGLIIISEYISTLIRTQLNDIRAKRPVPLIYELPPPTGKPRKMDYRSILRQVLGV